MTEPTYSSIDERTGKRIGKGWLTARTAEIQLQVQKARLEFSGKKSRANLFRHYVTYGKRLIGDDWICQFHSGDIRGRDKDARWGLLFFIPHVDGDFARLHIAMIEVQARHMYDRHAIIGPIVLAEVTDHAVARAIGRLGKEGDISYEQIRDEFRTGIPAILPLLFARIQALNENTSIDCPDLVVPTMSGALTTRVVESPGTPNHLRRRLIITSWLSDRTMRSQVQLLAVQTARSRNAVLRNDGKMVRLMSPFKSEPDAIRANFLETESEYAGPAQ